jgi:hypothetical protein
MQIIDLYIREGRKHTSEGFFPTQTRLVDTSTDFTTGNFRVGQLIKNLSSGTIGSITAIAPGGNVNTLDIEGGAFPNLPGQPYQIYDDYTKLELFKDESVSITDTIQNVKDPAKIFAPFSQQFSVPASKHNNKFFRHYYNSEIDNSFDARFQGDGLIQLNGVTYKVGKLRLTSVELKNNVAYSYKLVFTGETIEFKEILAENELSSLQFPESLNFEYTSSFVKSRLGTTIAVTDPDYDLLFPLITHTKNMRYGYNGNAGYKDAITNTFLNYADIKPALRAKVIIDAIESNYPQIKFSQQFFNSYSFKKLYLWLHREEGYMSNAEEGGDIQTISNRIYLRDNNANSSVNYNFLSGTEQRAMVVKKYRDNASIDNRSQFYYIFYLSVNVPTGITYDIQVLRNSDNSVFWGLNNLTTSQTVSFEVRLDNYANLSGIGSSVVDLQININTENTLGISQSLTVEKKKRTWNIITTVNTGIYEKAASVAQNTVSINRQIPKMKIFDFLKNIFTMFNLTAYKEDGIITVLPLDDYYNAGKTYDITKYVDTSKKTVSKLLQFKNMIFNFKSKKSFLVQYSEELQGNKFSEQSYGNDEWDGGDYKVEVGFEKMMYERLTDEVSNTLTEVQQGAMLDKKFEPTIGDPLLFYPAWTETTDVIKFDNSDNTFSNLIRYYRPSNAIVNISTGFINQTVNFGIEVDEYTLGTGSAAQQNQSNDLFTKYYRNYVANIFAKNARKTNVSAYLPLSIILKYRLNDIFVIGTTAYRINSIKTNLLTNKSDLELYNLTENVSQLLNNQLANLQRVENLESTAKTSSTIDFTYNSIKDPNLLRYEIYVDDIYNGFTNPGSFGSTVASLDSDTTYKISVRAIYDIDGEEAGAFDTDLFETTEKEPIAIAENGDTLITELSETIILE